MDREENFRAQSTVLQKKTKMRQPFPQISEHDASRSDDNNAQKGLYSMK